MSMKQINFLAKDGIELNGLLYTSKNNTRKIILSVHGMTSNCFKKREEVIAEYANKANIDYFCFNNRGSELVKYIKKQIDGKDIKSLGGTSFEDVLDGYSDIVGAITKLKGIGYEEIYLQGHSLGSTKVVYTYNELKGEKNTLLENIKGIILLSLVDIPTSIKIYSKENFIKFIKTAESKVETGKGKELMPFEAFIHPISTKTFLRYALDNEKIDFARFGKDNKLEVLNNINIPLFMRWGNVHEMILQEADQLVTMINDIVKNERKDINYIDGADHGYTAKEAALAEQIIGFIQR